MKKSAYWRSLDELAQTEEFRELVAREFPGDAWDVLPPATRRQFLKVMGASLGFAGLVACRWPKEEIVPFASRPEGRTPGVPERFATALELGGSACGLLVTSFDGRPVKVDGNPRHPDSLGAASAVMQAGILELYDPDRSTNPVERAGGEEFSRTWDDFDRAAEGLVADLRSTGGAGLAVLSESSSSPTLRRLRTEMTNALPDAGWYEYEPLSRDCERLGLRAAYGSDLRAHPRLDRAAVIACLDADPLGDHPASIRLARELVAGRNGDEGSMSRLWVAESGFTLSGAAADERLAVARGLTPAVLARLVREMGETHGVPLPPGIAAALGGAGEQLGSDESAWVEALAADLAANLGHTLIMVGPAQPPDVHAVVAAVNDALGNVGETVTYTEADDQGRPAHGEAIAELARRLRDDEITALLVLGGNPAYDAPAELGFADLLNRPAMSIRLGLFEDETSNLCTWHLPRAHFLEAWGDLRSWDGTWSVTQPLIEPLYGGRTSAELVAALVGEASTAAYEITRSTAAELGPDGEFESFWRSALHEGIIEGTATPEARPSLVQAGVSDAVAGLAELGAATPPTADGLEISFTPGAGVVDGRGANNAWLQELPDPITKITWGNAALVAPETAAELDLVEGDVVAIEAGGDPVELPVSVQPGHSPFSVSVSLGYGRTAAGRVGDGVGVDVYPLRPAATPYRATGVSLRRTGRRQDLAATQEHHAIDTIGLEARQGRIAELVRELPLATYLEDPHAVEHLAHQMPLFSLWKEHQYEGEQWGMSVDLNACIGCNACVAACQAENNIPVVGRRQVLEGREMHWIRIDRYYRGDPADPKVVFQPVACVHCEMAPCEQVCPVAATQHTHDGLNAMTYNRCVGTRYCSNNCPYKVRRFNFFNYHKDLTQVEEMGFNPEVTVRSRGVMEKCTYCVQRIEAVRIEARAADRPITDGEIVPACAQTCPTQAIVFGNLNDPTSEVSGLREHDRAYSMLAELNVRPRTQYLARLRNPVASGVDEGHEPAGDHGPAAGHGKESV